MNQTEEFWRLKQKAQELMWETDAFEVKYHPDCYTSKPNYLSVIVTKLIGAVQYFEDEERDNYSE